MPATLREVVETSRAVRATPSRLEKQALLASLFARLDPDDLRLAVSYLAGEIPQGRLGVGWKAVSTAMSGPTPPARGGANATLPLFGADPARQEVIGPARESPDSELTLAEVDRAFTALARTQGSGSAGRGLAILGDLFRRAGTEGREFLAALLIGELRQGALRAVVRDAVARALEIAPEAIARAEMFGGNLAEVATVVRREGKGGLQRFAPRPMLPVAPMLARTAADAVEALRGLGAAAAETKLDGVRIQLHKQGDVVRIFSRQLRELTESAPEVVELGHSLAAESAILDGEAIALDTAGRPLAFQDTMSRVGRALDPLRARAEQPLTVLFFDLLYLDGRALIDRPYAERWQALEAVTGGRHLTRRVLVEDPAAVDSFMNEVLTAGHEGVVIKALESPYIAGRRGGQWRKLKPATTLDLVILAAEWGHGRRRGYLSNIHLGARDPVDPHRFWMLGKTFKGLTDAMLRAMTDDLLTLAVADNEASETASEYVVRVRPERVVEIAFDTVQRSSRYDSGFALRFARVKRFRPDKSTSEATTLDEVREIDACQRDRGTGEHQH
jgi:DNA ligase-1